MGLRNNMHDGLFSRSGLSLDRLRVLLDVRDAGSISKAAAGDPVRQSQYSRQLKELETFFGLELTTRQGRNLKLTSVGEQLAALVREQFVSLEEFARQSAGEPAVYAIGAGESLIHWLILPRLARLNSALPGVSFRLPNLQTRDIIEQLHARILDFGILRTDRIPASFHKRAIGRLSYRLAVPQPLKSRVGKKPQPDILGNIPLAVMGGDSSVGRSILDISRSTGVKLNVAVECDSFPAIVRAIGSGRVAGIIPDLAIADLALQGADLHTLNILTPLDSSMSLVWLPRRLKVRPSADKVRRQLCAALAI